MIRHMIVILASVVSGAVMAADGSPRDSHCADASSWGHAGDGPCSATERRLFCLGIPETIGCREALLVNFPEAQVDWDGPDSDGAVFVFVGAGRSDFLFAAIGADRGVSSTSR